MVWDDEVGVLLIMGDRMFVVVIMVVGFWMGEGSVGC